VGEERRNLFDVGSLRVKGGEEFEHVIVESCGSADSCSHLCSSA
jgi:hypothetical protein